MFSFLLFTEQSSYRALDSFLFLPFIQRVLTTGCTATEGITKIMGQSTICGIYYCSTEIYNTK